MLRSLITGTKRLTPNLRALLQHPLELILLEAALIEG